MFIFDLRILLLHIVTRKQAEYLFLTALHPLFTSAVGLGSGQPRSGRTLGVAALSSVNSVPKHGRWTSLQQLRAGINSDHLDFCF